MISCCLQFEANKNSTITDSTFGEHSTGKLKVIGSVLNSEDFGKAYNCAIGGAINHEKNAISRNKRFT